MQDLKKYGAIGGAISLALCWPLAVGHIGQKVVEDGVAHLNSEYMQSEVVEYDRGYLSSQVKTRYRVTDPALIEQLTVDGLPTEAIVESAVSHGLMSITAVSTLENMESLPLTLTTVTQLNGNTAYELNLAAYNQESQGSMISVSPASLSGDVTVLGDLSYQLDMPSVEIDFASGDKMVLNKLVGQGSGKKVNNFWLGEQDIQFNEFIVEDGSQIPAFTMGHSRYHFSSSMDEVNKTVSSQHKMTLNNLEGNSGQVEQLELDLAFGNLDSEAFDKLVTLYQTRPALNNEEVQQAISLAETLFSKGFYVAISPLAVNLGGDSEFSSKLHIEVPEGSGNVTQDPTKVLSTLKGNVESFLSHQLVEQYPFVKQNLDEAIIMEMVEETELGYQMKADLQEGSLVFENGQEIPLMALLLPMMMQQ